MRAVGLIFSNIHNSSIPELTHTRTMASVPFGCRYRLVDFPLSGMVHSGIERIGIITHNSYQSLMDHIGTGKDWDLARRSGGIQLLPPFVGASDRGTPGQLYRTRLEALMGAKGFLERSSEEVVVLSDCDGICSIDLGSVIRHHEKTGAKLTLVTRRASQRERLTREDVRIRSDGDGRIFDAVTCVADQSAEEISTHIAVADRIHLLDILREAEAHGYTDFYRDIVAGYATCGKFYRYFYEGTYLRISSLESYFTASMGLLEPRIRADLFREDRPILTKLRNSAPTRYLDGACVTGSYVADGCVIEGQVENSILFRGVRIGKGSVVKNSILLQDTTVGSGVSLQCVITDKNVTLRDGRCLSGHESMPLFIGKGRMV